MVSAIFDEQKLKWLNGLYIKELTPDEFLAAATPYLDESKVAGRYDYKKLCALIQGRVDALTEIPDKVNFLEEFGEFDNSLYVNAKQKSDAEIAKQNLPAVVSLLEGIPDDKWENAELYSALKLLAEKTGVKNSQLLWPMRVALSGRESTPGGATELAELLGKKETLRRLAFSLSKL